MEPLTIIGLATAAILFFSGGGQLRKQVAIKLSPSQLDNIDIIETEFRNAGFTVSVAAAAVVNAYAESKLNHLAKGDGGHSIGLFQLNDWGAGKGMTVEARQDPVINTRRIIEVAQGHYGKDLREFNDAQSTDVPQITAVFCRDIERPADTNAKMNSRAALAIKMFPNMR
jgi:hypothetical protein